MSDYETKDSGARATFASGMQRDTQEGKPRWDLLLPLNVPYGEQLLTRFAALMERGARKYDPRNWEKANSVEEMERMKSSAIRHLMQWAMGEADEDHAAAAMFNLLAYETTKYKVEAAERPTPKLSAPMREPSIFVNHVAAPAASVSELHKFFSNAAKGDVR